MTAGKVSRTSSPAAAGGARAGRDSEVEDEVDRLKEAARRAGVLVRGDSDAPGGNVQDEVARLEEAARRIGLPVRGSPSGAEGRGSRTRPTRS